MPEQIVIDLTPEQAEDIGNHLVGWGESRKSVRMTVEEGSIDISVLPRNNAAEVTIEGDPA